jgi:hypothetical protein
VAVITGNSGQAVDAGHHFKIVFGKAHSRTPTSVADAYITEGASESVQWNL